MIFLGRDKEFIKKYARNTRERVLKFRR